MDIKEKTTLKNRFFLPVCAGLDSNQRRHKPTDLQSVVIDHSTTDAFLLLFVLLRAIQ